MEFCEISRQGIYQPSHGAPLRFSFAVAARSQFRRASIARAFRRRFTRQ
jgi:hypothetical protein